MQYEVRQKSLGILKLSVPGNTGWNGIGQTVPDGCKTSGEVRGHACHAEHDKTFSKITFFSITKK